MCVDMRRLAWDARRKHFASMRKVPNVFNRTVEEGMS